VAKIVPIGDLGTRMAEQGRIRLGERTAKAMRALDVFRFTSADKAALDQLAALYGGVVQPWTDPKANPQNQWQLKSEASDIRVFLPSGALSVWYEKWGGKGAERRCDGIDVEVPSRDPNEPYQTVPCICSQRNLMECKPYTRLNVILPEVNFGGVWRLETKSWAAAHEMPAMEAVLQELQTRGILEARLILAKQSIEGGRRQFVVPKLVLGVSTQAILEGAARVGSLAQPARAELEAGSGYDHEGDDFVNDEIDSEDGPGVVMPSPSVASSGADDDIVDAEVVEPTPPEPVATGNGRVEVVLAVKRLVAANPITDETETRHQLCRIASKQRTSSSKELTNSEVAALLGAIEEHLRGERDAVVEDGKFIRFGRKHAAR
jgi:hypothetical protein